MTQNLCLDQLSALDARKKELYNVRADVAEIQFRLIESKLPKNLVEEYVEASDKNNALEKQIDSIKKIIEAQDRALDLLDRMEQINRVKNDLRVDLHQVQFNRLYSKTIDELQKKRQMIIEEFDNAVAEQKKTPEVCQIPTIELYSNVKNPYLRKEAPKALYFAYGENMLSSELVKKIGKITDLGVARLENYQLVFNKRSLRDTYGHPNIMPAEEGRVVWGSLYEITNEQRERLNIIEGSPNHYVAESVEVKQRKETVEAITYTAVETVDGLKPSKELLEKMIKGAIEHKLPDDYRDKLLMIDSTIDKKSIKQQMKPTTVVCIKKENLTNLGYKNLEDWLKNPNHVYIGRNMSFYVKGANQSKWANKFTVEKYGREGCLKEYKKYILNSPLINDIEELRGKVLGCWCSPEPCHGDILIELLNEKTIQDGGSSEEVLRTDRGTSSETTLNDVVVKFGLDPKSNREELCAKLATMLIDE